VWGPGKEKERIGVIGDRLDDLVPLGPLDRIVARPPSSEVMSLVEDGNIPLLVLERIENGDAVGLGVVRGLLREVDRGDDEVLLFPDVLVGM
jgi:hypothetical protein